VPGRGRSRSVGHARDREQGSYTGRPCAAICALGPAARRAFEHAPHTGPRFDGVVIGPDDNMRCTPRKPSCRRTRAIHVEPGAHHTASGSTMPNVHLDEHSAVHQHGGRPGLQLRAIVDGFNETYDAITRRSCGARRARWRRTVRSPRATSRSGRAVARRRDRTRRPDRRSRTARRPVRTSTRLRSDP
jgi:hypothetical protein